MSRRDSDRAAEAAEAERLRPVRDRLEASLSGLAELECLRQRQEELVRTALQPRGAEEEEEELEENILLLRKQLNCLRRRDAGLISQLEELDRQISDLRLDTEESHDQSDSRPSSGFYELSDAASGSLSNSSNSVFSECFCSALEPDGRLPSTDELPSCLDCDGLWDDLSGTLHCSLSAPHPPVLDPFPSAASGDSQSKHHCDLVVWNGSDVYRYPSPLHAMAVQSPTFLQMLGHAGLGRDEGLLKAIEAESSSLPGSVSAPLVPQSSSWPVPSSSSSSHNPSQKHLDSYIYSLLQRRVLPVRTSRPRTSINTDPSKSLLRQASLCVRQLSLKGSELKPTWTGGARLAEGAASSSPQRQRSVDERETQNGFHGGSGDTKPNGLKINSSDLAQNQNSSLTNGLFTVKDMNTSTDGLLKKTSRGLLPPSAAETQHFKELRRPDANSAPKVNKPCPPDQSATPTSSPRPLRAGRAERGDGSVPELTSLGSSSQSPDEAGGGGGRGGGRSHMVHARSIPAQRQNIKLCKGGRKNPKTVKVKSTRTMKTSRTSEHDEPTNRKGDKSHRRCSCNKSLLLEDGGSAHIKLSKRSPGGAAGASRSRTRRLPPSIPEGRVLDRHSTGWSGKTNHCNHGNHHSHQLHQHQGHNQVVVVAKPKHKRKDYQRLCAIKDVPHDEAFRRTQRRRRKEILGNSVAVKPLPSGGPLRSPYSYTGGSDSEYSAECASLFHSTVVDTSEDERSNYTTNCFGDSESSEEDDVDESSSDAEEGGGRGTGGTGSGWNQSGARAVGQEMTPAQAKVCVKIKASHNLKKKILRFRSGSLKLMTTV
ncbi:dapper homolog 1 [Scophthalmus maximus]|uniref:dapper homolog 1 n=1 Tax=Scophthalmus maximus TaxID=52904 RepID=UPI000F35AE8A|nr:dapper homolog 1 [Scophthalmus maximus]